MSVHVGRNARISVALGEVRIAFGRAAITAELPPEFAEREAVAVAVEDALLGFLDRDGAIPLGPIHRRRREGVGIAILESRVPALVIPWSPVDLPS